MSAPVLPEWRGLEAIMLGYAAMVLEWHDTAAEREFLMGVVALYQTLDRKRQPPRVAQKTIAQQRIVSIAGYQRGAVPHPKKGNEP
jgi:hypothetical protein